MSNVSQRGINLQVKLVGDGNGHEEHCADFEPLFGELSADTWGVKCDSKNPIQCPCVVAKYRWAGCEEEED